MRRRLTAVLALAALPLAVAFCKPAAEDDASEGAAAASADAGDLLARADDDVVAYAELCKQELGITQPLPAMNCLDGEEVPITVNGQPLDETNYEAVKNGGGCDKPQWLQSACHNYDHIQRVNVGSPDVEAVLNCRQKYYTTHLNKAQRRAAYEAAPPEKKEEMYRLLYEFDDLGYILRNKRSGKTCFFTIFGRHYFGGYLPPPDMKELPSEETVYAQLPEPKPPTGFPKNEWHRDPKTAYLSPTSTSGGGCVGCHDLGGWKHSPFIDQVDVVPSNRSRQTPYLLVGNVFQQAFRSRSLLQVTTDPINGEGQRCTTCHALTAGGNNCSTFIDWSTGHYTGALSDAGQSWPDKAWMPMDHGVGSAEAFQTQYGKHIDRMKCCCQKPNARGCKTRAFGPTVAEMGMDGGTASLPEWRNAPADATESCLE